MKKRAYELKPGDVFGYDDEEYTVQSTRRVAKGYVRVMYRPVDRVQGITVPASSQFWIASENADPPPDKMAIVDLLGKHIGSFDECWALSDQILEVVE